MTKPQESLLPQTKVVIFDFDGVLVNSMPLHLEAWQQAASEVFGNELDDIKKYIGLSSKSIAGQIAESFEAPHLASTLLTRKQAKLRSTNLPAPLLPGVRTMWKHLNQNQIPYAICSNAPREFIDHQLSLHDLEPPPMICLEDTQNPKPMPHPYLATLKLLNVPKADKIHCLVFEDSAHGIMAAKSAGLTSCGITTYHSSDDLIRAGAEFTCQDLEEAFRSPNLNW
jgi:HAD superfamily hydrolase (TIGR01509 family)